MLEVGDILAFHETVLPHDFDLDRARYGMLVTNAIGNPQEGVVDLVNRSLYSADTYKYLETALRGSGQVQLAEDVLIAGKRREAKEMLSGVSQLWSTLFDVLLGYGTSPERLMGGWIIFIMGGAFAFRRRWMQAAVHGERTGSYNALWYAIDTFLPFVDLRIGEEWKPAADNRFLQHWLRIHMMFGWLLVPLGLLALAGVFN